MGLVDKLIPFRRPTQEADPEILKLQPFQTALQNCAVIIRVTAKQYVAIVGEDPQSKAFLDELIRTNREFRQGVQAVTRVLDLDLLVPSYRVLSTEQAIHEIRRLYPRDLQLRVNRKLLRVLKREDVVKNRGLYLDVQGLMIRPAHIGGHSLIFLRNELNKQDVRTAICRELGLPLEQAGQLRLDESVPSSDDAVLDALIKNYYPTEKEGMTPRQANRHGQAIDAEFRPLERPQAEKPDAPVSSVSNLFEDILTTGYLLGAADVMVRYQPQTESVIISQYINGVWQDQPSVWIGPANRYESLVVLAKNRSQGLPANYNFQKPEAGHITIQRSLKGGEVIQFSGRNMFFPVTPQFERMFPMIVCRIVKPVGEMLKLEQLGFHPWQMPAIERLLRLTGGIVLVVGTMGSGKQATILALLSRMIERAQGKKMALTFENPVELYLENPYINHSLLSDKEEVALDQLGKGMKSGHQLLYVDEINLDYKAIVTLRGGESGHLTFSTLHCEDAQSVVPRLAGMGISRDRIAHQVRAVISQRLLPLLCPECKRPQSLDEFPPDLVKYNLLRVLDFYGFFTRKFEPHTSTGLDQDGKRCTRCRGTGIVGRVAATEIWEPGFHKFQILEGRAQNVLRLTAMNFQPEGAEVGETYTTLLYNALSYAAAGMVSLQAVLDNCGIPDPLYEGMPSADKEAEIRAFEVRRQGYQARSAGGPTTSAPGAAEPFASRAADEETVIDAEIEEDDNHGHD